jgi:hypothetical protein
MRPYFKFGIPKLEMIPEEKAVWINFSPSNIDNFVQNLTKLKAADMDLCYKSLEVFWTIDLGSRVHIIREVARSRTGPF